MKYSQQNTISKTTINVGGLRQKSIVIEQGQSKHVQVESGNAYQLIFQKSNQQLIIDLDVIAKKEGSDLILLLEGESKVILDDYFTLCVDQACVMSLPSSDALYHIVDDQSLLLEDGTEVVYFYGARGILESIAQGDNALSEFISQSHVNVEEDSFLNWSTWSWSTWGWIGLGGLGLGAAVALATDDDSDDKDITLDDKDITLVGDAGVNRFTGNAGDDTLIGLEGNDGLRGGAGNDILHGGAGDDVLNGDAGNDTLTGGIGDDIINGGAGDDTLMGGIGADMLSGNAGNDTLTGGIGSDIFDYNIVENNNGNDTITDFNLTEEDKLNLADVLEYTSDDTLTDYLTISDNGTDVTISVDQNGDASGVDFTITLSDIGTSAIDLDYLLDNGLVVL